MTDLVSFSLKFSWTKRFHDRIRERRRRANHHGAVDDAFGVVAALDFEPANRFRSALAGAVRVRGAVPVDGAVFAAVCEPVGVGQTKQRTVRGAERSAVGQSVCRSELSAVRGAERSAVGQSIGRSELSAIGVSLHIELAYFTAERNAKRV